jgi:hypothetical protein
MTQLQLIRIHSTCRDRMLIGILLALLCCSLSCNENEPSAIITGKVRKRDGITSGYTVHSSDWDYDAVSDAAVSIVVITNSNQTTVASTKTGPDGSYSLSVPSTLPENTFLIVSHAPDCDELKDQFFSGRQPGWRPLGIVLRTAKKP